MALDGVEDAQGPVARQEHVGKAERIELVRTKGEVRAAVVGDHVGEVAVLLGPEGLQEALSRTAGEGGPLARTARLGRLARHLGADEQRVVPQGLYLHRLAPARRDDLRAHPRVHPGELEAFLPLGQETVGVHADAVAGARAIAIEDGGHRVGHPHAHEAGVDVAGVLGEQGAGVVRAAGGQAEARERDHAVAAPVREPVVAGDDGPARQAAADDEGVGGPPQLRQRAFPAAAGDPQPPALGRHQPLRVDTGEQPARGSEDVDRAAGEQLQAEHAGTEEVLAEVEPALPLALVLEGAVPEAVRHERGARHPEAQGRTVVVGPQDQITALSLRAAPDPRAALLEFLQSAYDAGAATAGWDADGLRSSWCPPATVFDPRPGA